MPAGVPHFVVYQNVDSDPRENFVSMNSPVTSVQAAGPNGRNTLDPDAHGAIAGLDPREAVAWSIDGGGSWGWGRQVGAGPIPGDYTMSGDDAVRLPWYSWQEPGSGAMHSNQPYYAYHESGRYTLRLRSAPHATTLTEAGGYGPEGKDVGIVTVRNLRTGAVGHTERLGSGMVKGALQPTGGRRARRQLRDLQHRHRRQGRGRHLPSEDGARRPRGDSLRDGRKRVRPRRAVRAAASVVRGGRAAPGAQAWRTKRSRLRLTRRSAAPLGRRLAPLLAGPSTHRQRRNRARARERRPPCGRQGPGARALARGRSLARPPRSPLRHHQQGPHRPTPPQRAGARRGPRASGALATCASRCARNVLRPALGGCPRARPRAGASRAARSACVDPNSTRDSAERSRYRPTGDSRPSAPSGYSLSLPRLNTSPRGRRRAASVRGCEAEHVLLRHALRVDELDQLAAAQVAIDARHDRVHHVVDVHERQRQVAVAEDQPALAGAAGDRAVQQPDAAAEDEPGPQDHGGEALGRGGAHLDLRLELGPRVRAALLRPWLERRGLVESASAARRPSREPTSS